MVLSDSLVGELLAKIQARVSTTEGSQEGIIDIVHTISKSITDGAGSGLATGGFSSTFTATTGGVTISLADSEDPLGGAGSDTPTDTDPEGTKLKAILIENKDATNFVTVKRGTNGEASILNGSTDGIKIDAGGFMLWHSPAGNNAMNDGVDDEFSFVANSASVSIKLTYLYG